MCLYARNREGTVLIACVFRFAIIDRSIGLDFFICRYQDYKCSAEDDKIAGGKMACDFDPNMEMRAHTQVTNPGP